jgi:hypothetical protein
MAAFGRAGRAAGWDQLTPEQIALIKERFIPWAPRWGGTGYVTEDRWLEQTFGHGRARASLIGGMHCGVITANGTPVVSQERTLEAALQAFARLPEQDRRPVVEDRGPHDPNLTEHADQPPPAGAIFVHVFCRPLERSADGLFRCAPTVDLSEFGGQSGNSIPGDFSEPQRESLWLTDAEVQDLFLTDHRVGDTFTAPQSIQRRMYLFYLFNWFVVSGGGYWAPRHLVDDAMTLTIEERTGDTIRLRLEGHATFKAVVNNGWEPPCFAISPRESKQTGLPDPYVVSFNPRILGTLEYDRARNKVTRFDAVALGDYVGNWGLSLKVTPVPVGFALELDDRNLPIERQRRAPYALSRLKGHYWAPDQWDGR